MKVNRLHSVASFLAFCAIVAFGSLAAKQSFGGAITIVSGTITSGDLQYVAVSGTAPNGSTWASYLSGSSPVAYFVVPGPYDEGYGTKFGSLMFDPKGKSASIVDFRYGYFGTIGSGTVGPYVYTTGTGLNAISTSSSMKTFPAGGWSGGVTTFPARLQGAVNLINTPTLTTSGDNIASTDGWFNLPWDFGAVAPTVSQAQMYSTSTGQGFRAAQSVNVAAPVNLLGYGNGIGMFGWTEAGVTGVQFGAVIPVRAVPEPSTVALAVLGGITTLGLRLRRRSAGKN